MPATGYEQQKRTVEDLIPEGIQLADCLYDVIVFGVLESSCLSLIIVTCVLSGRRRLSLPVLFCLNSFGGLDLKAEYETNAISGELFISKACEVDTDGREIRNTKSCSFQSEQKKKCKFNRKTPFVKNKVFFLLLLNKYLTQLHHFIYCKWLLFPQYQILMTLKINE